MNDTRPIGVAAPMRGVVYPPADELRQYVQDGVLGHVSLPQALRESFARHADRPALVGPEGEVSYGELDAITDRLASGLLRLGLAPLDRVMFQIGNCRELVYGFIGCLKAGLIPVCTLASHREQEIGYLARHANAVLHFVQGDDAKFDDVEFARAMQEKAPSLKFILQARGAARGGAVSLASLIDAEDPQIARATVRAVVHDPFQVAVFQLSGGTTVVPKIIPRFHNDYVCNMRAVAAWHDYSPDDVMYVPMPMMHNLNMVCCYGPMLLSGGAVAVAPDPAPATLLAVLRDYRPTWSVLFGPVAVRLEGTLREGMIDFKRARGIFAPNGAPRLRELTGAPVYHLYGMTEGDIMFARAGDPQEVLDHTAGRPVHPLDRIRIVRPGTEEDVAPGETGESIFKGPYTIHGYYDAAERNREAFTSDGWYRSGDLMAARVIDGQTYYVFQGRTKDVVSRGGEKISSEEVEWACATHPAVGACAVVPMPDPVYEERVCAFVIARPGHEAPDVAQLGAFLREYGLAKFKWPERIEVVSEFPMTQSGKLSKPTLKKRIEDMIAAEQSGAAGR